MRVLLTLFSAVLVGAALANPVAPGHGMEAAHVTASTQGLQDWIAAFRGRALAQGILADTFDRAMAGLRFRPDVIEKDRNQNEFTKTIWVYLDTAVSDDRVAAGKVALARNAALFDRIEAAYGVDRQVVAAIWGLESAYGAVRGDIGTPEALASLAYGSRRGAFFEGQLIAALRIVQRGDVAPQAMRGSWAGAMGHTQFMPGSFLDFAVDFDGDGRRDIWGNDPADALASTAAYLARWGWQQGQPWGVEVLLPQGFDYLLAGERVHKPVSEWQALGVTAATGALPPGPDASVLLPAGARGAAFLIYPNFHVLEHYNTADAYVIGVGHLADRLLGGPPIRAIWPRELRALTFDERVELQTRLTGAGFSAGGADGRIGPNTIAAVRAWQRAQGLIPDGYASPDLLVRLR